jgi:predicted MFS family arabinose efflux permease
VENRDNRRAWLVFIVIMIQSIALPMCQFKVPPVMGYLIEDLNVSMTMAGLMMSIFSIAGVVIAFPAAALLSKWGPKISGLVALFCAITGSVIGAVAETGAIMLLGRTIEGVSVGLLSVCAPTIISMWFPPEKRALPLAIWACWVPLGMVTMFNMTMPIVNAFGHWKSVWWFTAIICVVVSILYAIFVDAPEGGKIETRSSETEPKESIWKGIGSPSLLILAGAFFLFNLLSLSYYSWGPTYLVEVLGYSTASANSLSSLMGIGGITSGIVVAIALNFVKNKKRVVVATTLVYTVIIFFCFRLSSSMVVIYMFMLGLANGITPTVVSAVAPDTVKNPEHIGVAMAVLWGTSCNGGALVGPPLVGSFIEKLGWTGATIPTAGIAFVAFILALIWKLPKGEPILQKTANRQVMLNTFSD